MSELWTNMVQKVEIDRFQLVVPRKKNNKLGLATSLM